MFGTIKASISPYKCGGIVRTSIRNNSVKSYFDLFPKTFPHGGPPNESFEIPARQFRKEFRTLQSENHPDILIGSSALSKKQGTSDFSSLLNIAYSTISNPYTRINHIIEIYHPQHLDISNDEVSKKLIEEYQSESPETSLEYKDLLMTVLDAHESLEFASNENELDSLSEENDERIEQTEKYIDELLSSSELDWHKIMLEAIRLKYWVNIRNAIKDWEPGKPVHLTH
ncbi:J-type co-chaperone Jac1p, mitochondrial [[Candida] jaroonii]|uniref:J-type co-chaperone Jac1p, mitochondrial n=1 Tax=[Candida] jaroonii TaxID=467808 RepID=A0ACA9YAA3_9ASCO|nr:J-type co-chaperone Jac1p, mitochondrial [[Candida] jaroonii]